MADLVLIYVEVWPACQIIGYPLRVVKLLIAIAECIFNEGNERHKSLFSRGRSVAPANLSPHMASIENTNCIYLLFVSINAVGILTPRCLTKYQIYVCLAGGVITAKNDMELTRIDRAF